MRVEKTYLKSERLQGSASRLKSERLQTPIVTVSKTATQVTVKVSRSRRRASADANPTGFVVKIG